MARPEPKRATRIRASRLLGAVKDVIGSVAAKHTIPILSHIRISVQAGVITLTATDLDMQADRHCPTDDRDGPDSGDWVKSIAPFVATVPGKAFLAVLGAIDGDAMVTLSRDDASAARLTIAAGRSRFRLAMLPPEDLPLFGAYDVAHEFEIFAGVLADAIDSVEHAISSEETRYYLNGIYLHPVDMDLMFVATDGHRLARRRIDAPDGAHAWPAMIVPRAVCGELAKALAHAIKVAANPVVQMRAKTGGTMLSCTIPLGDDGEITLTSKAIDGTFPDYTRVIPHNPPRSLTVGRDLLTEAVTRVSALASKGSRMIRLDFTDDRIDLTAQTVEIGDAREEVPAVYEGDDQAFGFDGKYLRDVLGKIATDDIVIRWTDGEAPVRIEASGTAEPGELPALVHVLMPVRV